MLDDAHGCVYSHTFTQKGLLKVYTHTLKGMQIGNSKGYLCDKLTEVTQSPEIKTKETQGNTNQNSFTPLGFTK